MENAQMRFSAGGPAGVSRPLVVRADTWLRAKLQMRFRPIDALMARSAARSRSICAIETSWDGRASSGVGGWHRSRVARLNTAIYREDLTKLTLYMRLRSRADIGLGVSRAAMNLRLAKA